MPSVPGQQPKKTIKRPTLHTPTKLPAANRARFVQGQMKRAQPGVDATCWMRAVATGYWVRLSLLHSIHVHPQMEAACRKTEGFYLHLALIPSKDKDGNPCLQPLMLGSPCLKAVFASPDPSVPDTWKMHPDVYNKMVAAATGVQNQEYVWYELANEEVVVMLVCCREQALAMCVQQLRQRKIGKPALLDQIRKLLAEHFRIGTCASARCGHSPMHDMYNVQCTTRDVQPAGITGQSSHHSGQLVFPSNLTTCTIGAKKPT